jgi:hypothetical protein
MVFGFANADTVLSEDFEDSILDSRITTDMVGSFSSNPGIKNITNFGSSNAFGFGKSNCGANCFDNYVTSFVITFDTPTYISHITFREIELYGNWGSQGHVIIDGEWLTQPDQGQDFGREPTNDRVADTTYRERVFYIEGEVTTLELLVRDITNSSAIFIDDLLVVGDAGFPETWATTYTQLTTDAGDIEMLREFRDQVLLSGSEGRMLTEVLYEHSDAALAVLVKNPRLIRQANRLLATHRSAIEIVIDGDVGVITGSNEIIGFLKQFSQQAPPMLQLLAAAVIDSMNKKKSEGKPFFGLYLD